MTDKIYLYIQGTNIHNVERIDLGEARAIEGICCRTISLYTAGGRIDIMLFAENLDNLAITKEVKL